MRSLEAKATTGEGSCFSFFLSSLRFPSFCFFGFVALFGPAPFSPVGRLATVLAKRDKFPEIGSRAKHYEQTFLVLFSCILIFGTSSAAKAAAAGKSKFSSAAW